MLGCGNGRKSRGVSGPRMVATGMEAVTEMSPEGGNRDEYQVM